MDVPTDDAMELTTEEAMNARAHEGARNAAAVAAPVDTGNQEAAQIADAPHAASTPKRGMPSVATTDLTESRESKSQRARPKVIPGDDKQVATGAPGGSSAGTFLPAAAGYSRPAKYQIVQLEPAGYKSGWPKNAASYLDSAAATCADGGPDGASAYRVIKLQRTNAKDDGWATARDEAADSGWRTWPPRCCHVGGGARAPPPAASARDEPTAAPTTLPANRVGATLAPETAPRGRPSVTPGNLSAASRQSITTSAATTTTAKRDGWSQTTVTYAAAPTSTPSSIGDNREPEAGAGVADSAPGAIRWTLTAPRCDEYVARAARAEAIVRGLEPELRPPLPWYGMDCLTDAVNDIRCKIPLHIRLGDEMSAFLRSLPDDTPIYFELPGSQTPEGLIRELAGFYSTFDMKRRVQPHYFRFESDGLRWLKSTPPGTRVFLRLPPGSVNVEKQYSVAFSTVRLAVNLHPLVPEVPVIPRVAVEQSRRETAFPWQRATGGPPLLPPHALTPEAFLPLDLLPLDLIPLNFIPLDFIPRNLL